MPTLVLADAGPVHLGEWPAGRPAPMETFFRFAHSLGEALARVHDAGFIHGDVGSTNVVLNPAAGAVTLIDFGNAFRRTERVDALIESVLESDATPIERAEMYDLRVAAAVARGASDEALHWGRLGLAELGVTLPTPEDFGAALVESEAVTEELRDRSPTDLLDAPPMRDPETLTCMRILSHITSSALFASPALLAWTLARMFRLSLEHGNASFSANAHLGYGALLFAMGDENRGYAFGTLGMELARRSCDPVIECQASMIFGAHLGPWRVPLRGLVPVLERGISLGTAASELQYTGYSHTTLTGVLFSSGAELARVLSVIDRGRAFHSRNGLRIDITLAYRQGVLAMIGATAGRHDFDTDDFREASFLEGADAATLAVYRTIRLQTSYLFGAYERALRFSEEAARGFPYITGFFTLADHNFYTSLTLAAHCAQLTKTERQAAIDRIRVNQRQMSHWAEVCPSNFRHKHLLVEAELRRLDGDQLGAATRYEEAMTAAGRERFLQDEALANELAGRAYRSFGLLHSAERCLRAALDLYDSWGAQAKIRSLEEEFGDLRRAARTADLAVTPSGLDLFTISKSIATLASEANFDRLVETLVRICVEAAGAETGILVLEEEDGPRVWATGTAAGATVTRTPLLPTIDGPWAIIEHVRRTNEPLVIHDAAADDRFCSDPYVRRICPRGVLALPLLRQDRRVGVFYFENDVAPGFFNPSRVDVLELLAGQAAIAIELTRLFERLTTEVAERTRAESLVRFLGNASAVFAESLDVQTTLERIVRCVIPRFGERCAVHLLDGPNRLHRAALARDDGQGHTSVGDGASPFDPRTHPIFARVLRDREPLVSSASVIATSPRDYDAALHSIFDDDETKSVLAVPLESQSRALGVITFGSREAGRYHAPDVDVARDLARRASLALDNAYLYREAREAIRVRDEFLSIASHELHTPVTSMKLAMQAILSETIPRNPENIERVLGVTLKQLGRLTTLVDELLDVSRIRSGRMDLRLECVELGQLVAEAVERFVDEANRAGVCLEIEARSPVWGQWDRSRLDQVVANLVSNAIKFGEKRPVRLIVERDRALARLTIRDHA